jgi:hypothetical protein
VQLMHPFSAKTLSNEYVLNGYKESFGRYDVNPIAHPVTDHVEGSITRDLLVGKDQPHKFEFTSDGHLIFRSTRPDALIYHLGALLRNGECDAAK